MGKARDLARLSPNTSGQLPTANIGNDAITADKIAANAIATDLGFTPASGSVFYRHPTAITPSAQFTSSIPVGVSLFDISGLTADNVYRTFFTDMNDFNGFIYTRIGDQPIQDTASHQASLPHPAYGVANWNRISGHDNGWPSGAFDLTFVSTGSFWNLQLKFSSYYSSSNSSGGRILFVRL